MSREEIFVHINKKYIYIKLQSHSKRSPHQLHNWSSSLSTWAKRPQSFLYKLLVFKETSRCPKLWSHSSICSVVCNLQPGSLHLQSKTRVCQCCRVLPGNLPAPRWSPVAKGKPWEANADNQFTAVWRGGSLHGHASCHCTERQCESHVKQPADAPESQALQTHYYYYTH